MSSLQRLDVYQKAGRYHPAFGPSGIANSDVREVAETDEDALTPIVPDAVFERAPAVADRQVINSEKWCGDQRTRYAVVKAEATSFALALLVALAVMVVSVMFPEEFSLFGP